MKHDDKRAIRRMKKSIKRTGHKHARHQAKEILRTNPEEMRQDDDLDYGKSKSDWLNGFFRQEPIEPDVD